MAARPLYSPHSPALTTLYGDLENYARAATHAFAGTAGSVLERSNASGFRFFTHQYYDGAGRRTEKYLAGPVDDPDAKALAEDTGRRIAELKQVVPELRLLGREGYALVQPRTYATLASLYNDRYFEAGALLIGSHAYGALLNQLGARAAPYATQDVDIASGAKLAFEEPPSRSFLESLKTSGIEFFEVPQLNRRKPGTSFKETGRSSFQVDLLVPSDSDEAGTVALPELRAHATALPYLRYLLREPQQSIILAREGCCMVNVPSPERFALHKLIVSQLRKARSEKSGKDILQASVLFAILADNHPGALETAAKQVPASAWKHVEAAAIVARRHLAPHPRATEVLEGMLAARRTGSKRA